MSGVSRVDNHLVIVGVIKSSIVINKLIKAIEELNQVINTLAIVKIIQAAIEKFNLAIIIIIKIINFAGIVIEAEMIHLGVGID